MNTMYGMYTIPCIIVLCKTVMSKKSSVLYLVDRILFNLIIKILYYFKHNIGIVKTCLNILYF